MKLIFTSYVSTPEFNQPEDWLKRIEGYTGILESLSSRHSVFGIERINYKGELKKNGVNYFFVRQKRKVPLFPFHIHRLVHKLHPEVVFINGFVFPAQIIQLRLSIGKNAKIIILHRAERPFRGVKKYLQKLADKCVNAYLFTSFNSAQEWLQKGIIKNEKKIHEVIQASSVFHAKPTRKPNTTNVFLWVGRLDANKDPLTVVNAFIQFLQFQPSVKLYMIYQEAGLLEQVKDLISSKKITKIELVGKVSHNDLQDWFHRSDFIISGSHYEGSGVAVCEAMSCGCVPIVTNIPSFRKMTDNGKCGLLYEAGNVNGLLEGLLQTSTMNIDNESKKAIEQFQKEFSFDAIANKIENIIANR